MGVFEQEHTHHVFLCCSLFFYRGVAIEMTCPKYVAPTFTDEIKLVAFPQNLPSIVVSHVLNPQPGEVILDMCAAPGEYKDSISAMLV